MSDEAVKNFLLSTVCCRQEIDLTELISALPCLTTEERDSITEFYRNHGNNSAWKRLLNILYKGEEFGLVQLSIVVHKINADLAKNINRGNNAKSCRAQSNSFLLFISLPTTKSAGSLQ